MTKTAHATVWGLVVLLGLAAAAWQCWRDRAPVSGNAPASSIDVLGTATRAGERTPGTETPPGPLPSAPSPTRPAGPADEASLMTRLRAAAASESADAVDLALEGNARFPDGADAPERTSILIHALARQGRASEARGEAEGMVNRYPDSPWVREIEAFTGAHRHRNIRVDADGAIFFE
jgi:hypothetical protein